MDNNFWRRIRQARRVADLTQMKLAQLCGVTRSAVAQWESPNRDVHVDPTPDRIALIAKHTGTSVNWLMTGDEAEAPTSLDQIRSPDPAKAWASLGERYLKPQFSVDVDVEELKTPGEADLVVKRPGIPDMVIGTKVFAFAQSAQEYAEKARTLAAKYPGTKAYVMLITPEVTVVPVTSAADALTSVARLISEN